MKNLSASEAQPQTIWRLEAFARLKGTTYNPPDIVSNVRTAALTATTFSKSVILHQAIFGSGRRIEAWVNPPVRTELMGQPWEFAVGPPGEIAARWRSQPSCATSCAPARGYTTPPAPNQGLTPLSGLRFPLSGINVRPGREPAADSEESPPALGPPEPPAPGSMPPLSAVDLTGRPAADRNSSRETSR